MWIYDAENIDPLDYEGFVYLITNTTTGRMYVGRKYIYQRRKKKKAGVSDWVNYFGSSKALKADIDLLGKDCFKREILHWCKTRAATNYLEVKEQFKRDVLEAVFADGSRAYYNQNILARYFAKPIAPAVKASAL